jgi:hypothetical protein
MEATKKPCKDGDSSCPIVSENDAISVRGPMEPVSKPYNRPDMATMPPTTNSRVVGAMLCGTYGSCGRSSMEDACSRIDGTRNDISDAG